MLVGPNNEITIICFNNIYVQLNLEFYFISVWDETNVNDIYIRPGYMQLYV